MKLSSLSCGAAALFALSASLPFGASKAEAAPRAQALSFAVSGRFIALQNGRNIGGAPQVLDARVVLSGNRARLETDSQDQTVVFLYAPPYLYKLLPQQRAGVRWKVSSLAGKGGASTLGGLDWQNALRRPQNIPAELKKRGAKRVGSAKLNGQLADIYSGTIPAGMAGAPSTVIKAWLRRGDALPLRVETRSRTLFGVVNWKNYRRAAANEGLFRVPRDYSLRDSTSRPRLF